MVKIENRAIMKKGLTSAVITLPARHSIIKENDLHMVIGERVIILASNEMKISEIKSEGTELLKNL